MKTITWFWEEMDGNPKAHLNVLVWEFCDHEFCPDTDSPEDENEGWWDIIDHDCGESNEDGDIDPREVVGRAMLKHRVNRLEEFGVVEPPQSLGEVA